MEFPAEDLMAARNARGAAAPRGKVARLAGQRGGRVPAGHRARPAEPLETEGRPVLLLQALLAVRRGPLCVPPPARERPRPGAEARLPAWLATFPLRWLVLRAH